MPPTRQNTKQTPQPSLPSCSGKQQFDFPDNCHLIITTPRHVFAWDKSGVHSLFRSRRSSIVAARGAKDGSGVLAIASRNVVVLHDTKRGKDESWGLNANQEEVRHLEYSPDAKSLFLTTTSDGTIQRYDTESARLLDPAEKLVAAPVAMAISPTGHIVLSASQNPPVVYVKNLAHNTASSLLNPNASTAPVCCAVFHPERPNIFLLAFRDGTVAAYDATKMPKRDPDQTSAKDGEISRLQNLHRAVVTGDSSLDKSTLAAPIVGAAFLPGYKTRAVTAGHDGKCKIVDFANKGVILRSWHAKAPLTSISVLAVKPEIGRSARSSRNSQASGSHTIGGPTTTDSLIALGRIDGKVHIYDTVGILQAQKTVSAQEEKIISVEWARGSTPRAIDLGGVERRFSDAVSTDLRPAALKPSGQSQPDPDAKKQSSSPQDDPQDSPNQQAPIRSPPVVPAPTRKFTVHPDEVDDGTVRHVPSPQRSRAAIPATTGYDDLFSPVKADTIKTKKSPKKAPRERVISPGRDRPRLSSQTFVKSPDGQAGHTTADVVSPRKVSLAQTAQRHTTSVDSANERRQSKPAIPPKSSRRGKPVVTTRSTRRTSLARVIVPVSDGTTSRNSTATQLSNFNAKVLSDLRKLNGNKDVLHGHGVLSAYTVPQRTDPVAEPLQPSSIVSQLRGETAQAKKRSVHLSDSETWPTDSAVGAEEDIWLTDEPEDTQNQQRKRREDRMSRPPARQTTRSKFERQGTKSTAVHDASTHQRVSHHARHVDGSTEEDVFSAETHMTPAVHFSPASENVRELFPRTTSLSPHKSRSPTKKATESPDRKGLGLTAMALNEALGRPGKSPWTRAKAGRRVPSPRKTSQVARQHRAGTGVENREVATFGVLARSPSHQCLICPDNTTRIQTLESEVAMMKGEILAMKALLRRNGLPFPACLR